MGADRVAGPAAATGSGRPKARVYAQESYPAGRWVWWITAIGNNVVLAKSPKTYSSERSALEAAQGVANLGELEIDERNLP
jgi:hypothetical protein